MKNHYQNGRERYQILKTDAIYQVKNNLRFKSYLITKSYLKEKEEIIELINADCKQSLKLVLKLLKERYKHCPAKGPLEAMLKEYY